MTIEKIKFYINQPTIIFHDLFHPLIQVTISVTTSISISSVPPVAMSWRWRLGEVHDTSTTTGWWFQPSWKVKIKHVFSSTTWDCSQFPPRNCGPIMSTTSRFVSSAPWSASTSVAILAEAKHCSMESSKYQNKKQKEKHERNMNKTWKQPHEKPWNW